MTTAAVHSAICTIVSNTLNTLSHICYSFRLGGQDRCVWLVVSTCTAGGTQKTATTMEWQEECGLFAGETRLKPPMSRAQSALISTAHKSSIYKSGIILGWLGESLFHWIATRQMKKKKEYLLSMVFFVFEKTHRYVTVRTSKGVLHRLSSPTLSLWLFHSHTHIETGRKCTVP